MQALLDSIHNGLLMIDMDGNIIKVNKAAERLLGVTGEQVLGLPIHQVFPESKLPRVLHTQEAQVSQEQSVDRYTLVVNRSPVYDNLGRLVGAVAVFQDITELESVSRELSKIKELKNELEAVFDASYDEIYVTDGTGTTTSINKVGESYYGVKAEEMVGKNVRELEKLGYFSPSVVDIVLEEKRRITIPQKTKTGKQLIVTANPVFEEDNNIIRVVVNSRDVTELTNLRQKLQDTEKLAETYRNQIMQMKEKHDESLTIIADSDQMKQILEMVTRVAQVESTVLMLGESGVGKGVLAKKIHDLSKRAEGRFITINCGAIPENLLESELFGYEPGAFSGARKEGKKGLIEMVHKGTLLLDEVGELPLSLQVKLLTVIQERKVMRVGGSESKSVDIRIIAATNRDIQKMVKEGEFREDLYYRLNVIPVVIPPLRHRKEDIPPLVHYFLAKFNGKYQLNKKVTPEALELMTNCYWKGNVREVENIIERLVVTTDSNDIEPAHLPDYILNSSTSVNNRVYVMDICPLREATEELERQMISKAFERYDNTYKMAEVLDVNQSTIVRKMKKYIGKDNRPRGRRPGQNAKNHLET